MVEIWIGCVTVIFGYWFTFTSLQSYKLLMRFVGVVCIRLYGVVSVY